MTVTTTTTTFYSVREVARRLDVNPATILRRIKDKELDAIKTSAKGNYRISQEALEKYLANK